MTGRRTGLSTALAGALALGACAAGSGMEITRPDLALLAAGPAGDRVVGTAPLVVRAYVRDEAGVMTEVDGASCRIRSAELDARFDAPRRLMLPIYAQGARFADRGAPAPAEITCSAGGASGTVTLVPTPVSSYPTRTYVPTPGTTAGTNTIAVRTVTLTKGRDTINPWTYGSETEIDMGS